MNSQSSSTLLSLLTISTHLHAFHHRNRNQHRLAKWYKGFSTLRRQVDKLIKEVEKLEEAERFDDKGAGVGESKYVKKARENVEKRIEFWEMKFWEVWFL